MQNLKILFLIFAISVAPVFGSACKHKPENQSDAAVNAVPEDAEPDQQLVDSSVNAQPTPSSSDQTRNDILNKLFEKDKYTYLFFYEDDNTECLLQRKLIDMAEQSIASKANIRKIDRNDPANRETVKMFGAVDATVPYTLLYTPDRYLLRRFERMISHKTIINTIPGPTQEKIIKTFREHKLSLVCFYSEEMEDFPATDKKCRAAAEQMSDTTRYYKVNIRDPYEKNFLWKMKLSEEETIPFVAIMNLQGKIDWTSRGVIPVETLKEALTQEFDKGIGRK